MNLPVNALTVFRHESKSRYGSASWISRNLRMASASSRAHSARISVRRFSVCSRNRCCCRTCSLSSKNVRVMLVLATYLRSQRLRWWMGSAGALAMMSAHPLATTAPTMPCKNAASAIAGVEPTVPCSSTTRQSLDPTVFASHSPATRPSFT